MTESETQKVWLTLESTEPIDGEYVIGKIRKKNKEPNAEFVSIERSFATTNESSDTITYIVEYKPNI